MKTNLTVDDPLANQEVTILVTLTASDHPREERPLLITLGVAEQMPVSKTGMLSDVAALIDEAWTAFGVWAQVAAATAEDETVVAEQLIATAEIDASEPVPTVSPPTPLPPKPQARNLSLF